MPCWKVVDAPPAPPLDSCPSAPVGGSPNWPWYETLRYQLSPRVVARVGLRLMKVPVPPNAPGARISSDSAKICVLVKPSGLVSTISRSLRYTCPPIKIGRAHV